jgi:hypothetical protein
LKPFQCGVHVLDAYVGTMMELRVVDHTSGPTVGLYREGRAKPTFKAQIFGILDEQTTYEVSAYADVNGSAKYDDGDPSWKLELVSDGYGATVDLDLSAVPTSAIETGEQ